MKLSPEERETIILFSDADDTASVYTFDRRLIKKLEELCKKYPEEIRMECKADYGAYFYAVPKTCVSIRAPFTRERREAASRIAKERGYLPPVRSTGSGNE